MARVAIDGLGRIGRATLELLLDEPAPELVAVNDLAPADDLGYLLRRFRHRDDLDRPLGAGAEPTRA